MKKYILLILSFSLLLFPLFANAAWWNPISWFSLIENLFTPHTEIVYVQVPATTTATVLTSTTSTTQSATETTSINQTPVISKTPVQSKAAVETHVSPVVQTQSLPPAVSAPVVQNSIPSPTTAPATPPVISQVLPAATSSATISIADANSNLSATNSTTSGEFLGLPVLVFDVYSSTTLNPHALYFHSLTLNVSGSGQGSVNEAYLYADSYGSSIPIASALVQNGIAIFSLSQSSFQYVNVVGNYEYAVKVDVSGLTDPGDSETVSTSVAGISLTDSSGQVFTATGSATGNIITVAKSGN